MSAGLLFAQLFAGFVFKNGAVFAIGSPHLVALEKKIAIGSRVMAAEDPAQNGKSSTATKPVQFMGLSVVGNDGISATITYLELLSKLMKLFCFWHLEKSLEINAMQCNPLLYKQMQSNKGISCSSYANSWRFIETL